MRKVVLILVVCSKVLLAAFELQNFNPEVVAVGNISSVVPGGINPAVFNPNKGLRVGFYYANLYRIKSLKVYSAEVGWQSVRDYQICGRYSILGNQFYQEQSYDLAFGKVFRPNFNIGCRISIFQLYVQDYQVEPTGAISLGMYYLLDTNLAVGLLLSNLNQPKLHNLANEIPRVYNLGCQWRVNRHLDILGEITKDLDFQPTGKVGFRFRVFSFWKVLGGIQLNPDLFNLGSLLSWRGIEAKFALSLHPNLPSTFYCGLSWQR